MMNQLSESNRILQDSTMENMTLSYYMGGNVPMQEFSRSMTSLYRLIDLLSKDIGRGADIEWMVEELAGGSAAITLRGVSSEPEAVLRVRRAYVTIGQSLERGLEIPYSPEIRHAAENLTKVLNGQITSVQFEAGNEVATVTSGVPAEQAAATLGAYGSVEGRVETLTHRRWLGFFLYDLLTDQAVRCYLTPDQVDLVRNAFDRRATVRGWIRRDPRSGRPISINPVLSIDVAPEVAPGAFLRARAISPRGENDPSPEDAIRRLRDA